MVNRRVGNLRKDRDRGGKRGGFFSHYRPPPADHVKRQAERKGGKFDSIFKGNFDTFTPKEGDNTIRILPAGWEGHTDFAYTAWIHWGVGADESSYLCLRKMKNGETCPICQEVARMKANGEGDDAKRIDCKERFICWMINRADRDETPTLWSMPAQVYKDINALCYSSRSGKAIFVDNPDAGYDIILRRTGTKINTKYLPQVDREATAVTDDADKYKELEDWVQDNQIPDCLQFFDADYLERALSGEIDRNADEDEDDRPKRGWRRDQEDEDDDDAPRSNGRRRVQARDDDEDEDDPPPRKGRSRREEPEDDEDGPPPRKRGSKARDADEDLEDELPFDEDEDDSPEAESANEAREARQDRQVRSRGRTRDADEDEPEDRPRSNKRPSKRDEPEDDDEDDDPPPRKGGRTRARDEDEDDSPRQRPKADRDRGGRSSGNRRV